jgi:aminocarboxymuconate-semialdehyde decarboxylase
MRVDVHNHALPNEALELLRSDATYGASFDGDRVTFNGSTIGVRPVNVDARAKLAELAAMRIDAAVVCPTPALFFAGLDAEAAEVLSRAVNDGLAGFERAEPERFRWMAHVPLEHPERAVGVLEDAKAAGAAGVEIPTSISGRRVDAAEFEPFWAAAERLDLPVFPHPYENEPHPALESWHLDNVIGNLLETTITAERLILAGVLDRYPGLRILLAHAGGFFPFQAGRLRHARTVRAELVDTPEDPWSYRGRLIVDTITHDVDALRYVVERMGAENVVLGTDLPAPMAPPQPVDELEQAVGAETAAQIATTNARRLYGLG